MSGFEPKSPKPSANQQSGNDRDGNRSSWNNTGGAPFFLPPARPRQLSDGEIQTKTKGSLINEGPGIFGQALFFKPPPRLRQTSNADLQTKKEEPLEGENEKTTDKSEPVSGTAAPQVEGQETQEDETVSDPSDQLTSTTELGTPPSEIEDPKATAMRSAIRYDTALTLEQKEYFKWDQVLEAFKTLESHAQLSDYYLQRWARKQLSLGWSIGQAVPDLNAFRAYYGDPYVYQVTKKKVPTLYVHWYGGNKSDIRNELLNNRNYDGFWVYIDSITGHKSELQQRDSFSKYYDTNPISSSDVQLVFTFLELKGKKIEGNTTAVTKESGTFRKAVERAQDLIYGSQVKGYGLLTQETKTRITQELKKAQLDQEKEFTSRNGEKKFKDVGNITGLAKDPPKKDPKSGEWVGGGVNLRSIPFTLDDPEPKANDVFYNVVAKSIVEHLPFGTRMTILRETVKGSDGNDPGWYWVMSETGKKGYVAKHLVETRLPAPDVRYHLVVKGDSLLKIARQYYSPKSEDRVGIVESNGEFRNYVLELARYNEEWRQDEAGAVFEEGFDSDDPNSWKHTVARKDLRMWIPSAAEMYYRIHNKPEEQKFDNTNWAEDGGQWIIDNSPVTVMINAYLDWWATIPQEVREKNVQKYYKQQLDLYTKMQADWSWLDSYILPLVPMIPGAGAAVGVSFIYDLYISFNIGYFEFLSQSDPKLLVMSAERTLRNLTQLEHYKGLLFGFFEGVYDWGKDLVDSFVMIGEAIGSLAGILSDPETYEKIGEFAGDALEYVITNKDEIKNSLRDLSFMEVIIGAMSGMRSKLKEQGKSMGNGAAQTLVQFAGGSPYDQGFSFGKIIGFIVPEIVLAVASSGIWVAVKGALKSLQIVSKILKPILSGVKMGLNMLKSALGAASDLVKFIKTFIGSILSKAKKGASKFWEKMQELFEGFHNFLKSKYDDVAKTKKTGTPDVDDYADTNKSRLREEVKKDLDPGDEYTERLEDAIKAFAIIEMNDELDPSPPAFEVVAFLNAVIDLPKNDKFVSRRISGDLFEISFNPNKKYTQGKKTPMGVPSLNNAKFDWEHIFDGHSDWGKKAKQSGKKDIFEGLNEVQIKDVVKGAYSNITYHERSITQEGIIIMRGKYQSWVIEFIVDTKTKIIKTAYPKGRKLN